MDYRVDIAPKTHRASIAGLDIGKSEFAAARWLLSDGADPTDTMLTFFDGKPSMRGSIGWWASHTVRETEKVGPVFAPWKADPRFIV